VTVYCIYYKLEFIKFIQAFGICIDPVGVRTPYCVFPTWVVNT